MRGVRRQAKSGRCSGSTDATSRPAASRGPAAPARLRLPPDGRSRPWRSFYRLTHGDPEPETPGGFYHLSRRPPAAPMSGSEVYIGPYDPEFDADAATGAVLSIDALCLNRDL